MTKYLVTGGAGFVGSHIVRRLVNEHKDVVIFEPHNANLERIKDILHLITIEEVDITNELAIKHAIKKHTPSIIFHLAAIGVKPNTTFNKTLFDVNFYGTMQLLNACKLVGFDCFINTGSAVEYGNTTQELTEDCPLAPMEDYGISKAACSHYCLKEAIINKLPVYTVRPFCIYGPGELPYRLVPSILMNGLQHKTIHLSSPHFVRDFIYIEDMVDFYITLSEQRPTNHFVFNAGTGIQHTIFDVVTKAQMCFDYPLNIQWEHMQPRPWEFKNWCANIDRANNILNWQPKHSLQDGIQKSYEWFKSNLKNDSIIKESVKECLKQQS